MTTASLKAAKEAFVTGHDGSTPLEVLLVCMAVVSGSALYDQAATAWWSAMYLSAKPCSGNKPSSAPPPPPPQQQQQQLDLILIAMEAVFVWFPMVLTQTNYLYPWGVAIMVVQITAMIALRQWNGTNESPEAAATESKKTTTAKSSTPQLDYLTLYRSSILYLTFVAILAVDFPLFPRRFCKTEVSGYGLMDVGAASFCLSAGFVSLRARRKNGTVGGSIRKSRLLKPLWHTLPLLIIGMIRIVANRELEYQEHVSEYGVHWNFFFTMGVLALVPPMVSLLVVVVDSNHQQDPSWVLPACIMGFYQLCLTMGNWQQFIEDAPRKCNADLQAWNDDLDHSNSLQVLVQQLPPILCSFVTANREGILGCLGYLSLYFIGEWIGCHWIWKSSATSIQKKHGLGLLALILWMIHVVLVDGLHIPVSRRSTNLSFCLWAVAHNVLLLYFLQLMTSWKTTGSTRMDGAPNFMVPLVWETVNRHGLLMFLIANLLTGLVNLTVPTLDVSDPSALVIIFLYICSVGAAAIFWDWLYCNLLKGRGKSGSKPKNDPRLKKQR